MKRLHWLFGKVVCCVLLIPFLVFASDTSTHKVPDDEQMEYRSIMFQAINEDADDDVSGNRKLRSPTVALTLSAILPGAGQIYNGSYWKTPIILGIGGYFVYAIVLLDDYYKDYRQQFRDSITAENPMGDNRLRVIRDFYRNQRDRFGWYLGFLYVINLVDAYVDAVLSGFDVGEDLTVRLMPYVKYNGTSGIHLRINF